MVQMMKNKQALLITIFSIAACALHAIMLQTRFNSYLYTSAFKVFIFILCPYIYFKVAKKGKFEDLTALFSMHGDRKNIRHALLMGLGVITLIVAAFTILLPFLDSVYIDDALADIGITAGNAFFVAIYIVVINAALEQFFFRGFAFMSLYRMGLKRYAHAFSALLFSFYHIPILFGAVTPGILVLCTVGLVAAGLIFNYLAVRFRSITGSLIVHISANLALILMIGWHFVLEIGTTAN